MNEPIPILTPVFALLRSRKFIVAVATLLVSLFLSVRPELAPIASPLVSLTVALGLAVIGGIAWEDAAKTGKEVADAGPKSTDIQLRELVSVILDELLTKPGTPIVVQAKDATQYIKRE